MPRQALASVPERIKMPRAMEISGENERALQAAAAAGRIPGAAKLCKCWTFDEIKFRRWIVDKERKPCPIDPKANEDRRVSQRTRSSAARPGGRVSRLPAASSEERYQQAMKRLRDAVRANGTTAR